MAFFRHWGGRICAFLITSSLGHGILIWLESKYQIVPARWVAWMIGQATNPEIVAGSLWVLTGLVGALGLGFWVLVERRWLPSAQKLQAKHKNSQPYDVPIFKVLRHVAQVTGDSDSQKFYPSTRAAIRQAAINGLTIWGRKEIALIGQDFSDAITEIPKGYWDISTIGAMAFAEHDDNMFKTVRHTNPESGSAWGRAATMKRNHILTFG